MKSGLSISSLHPLPGIRAAFIFWFCLLIASGCRAPLKGPSESLRLQVIYSSANCGCCPEKASGSWLDTIEQARMTIGRPVSLPAAGTTGFLLICMGQQPTGGFSILPASSTFRVQNGVALLDVIWQKPGQDSFVTQALTSPCLLLALEEGNYTTIIARDQDGIIRAKLTRPRPSR